MTVDLAALKRLLEEAPHYANRRPWELEPHRQRHVAAMTREDLSSKARIAEELAFRDQQIAALIAELEAARERIRVLEEKNARAG